MVFLFHLVVGEPGDHTNLHENSLIFNIQCSMEELEKGILQNFKMPEKILILEEHR